MSDHRRWRILIDENGREWGTTHDSCANEGEELIEVVPAAELDAAIADKGSGWDSYISRRYKELLEEVNLVGQQREMVAASSEQVTEHELEVRRIDKVLADSEHEVRRLAMQNAALRTAESWDLMSVRSKLKLSRAESQGWEGEAGWYRQQLEEIANVLGSGAGDCKENTCEGCTYELREAARIARRALNIAPSGQNDG